MPATIEPRLKSNVHKRITELHAGVYNAEYARFIGLASRVAVLAELIALLGGMLVSGV